MLSRHLAVELLGAALVCGVLPFVPRPPLTSALPPGISSLVRAGQPVPNAVSGPINILPPVTFWAWERPEDLRFLDPAETGVAFLAQTIYLPSTHASASADPPANFLVRPRLQPLRVSPGTPLMAVVRIETSPTASALTRERREALAAEIAALQNLSGVRAVQIDFDATASQHSFYFALLLDVRRQLRPSTPLSITALASWCIGDSWLAHLPSGTIDEAVPMLFRMGPDAANVAKFLHSGEEFRVPACQTSLGVSTDEPISQQLLSKHPAVMPAAWRDKRIYVFAPRAWTQPVADSVLQEWQP